MKVKILILCSILGGCAFDNPIGNLNNTLSNTNKILSGDMSPISKNDKQKDQINTASNKNKEDNSRNTKIIDAECDNWAKKSYKWHKYDSNKIYDKNDYKHKSIYSKKESEIIKIDMKLVRLCIQDSPDSAHGSNNQLPNEYLDKLGIDGFYH